MATHQGTTTPLELVNRAIEQRAVDLREARRGLGNAYDEYWCVFDVDTHPHLKEALELAASEHIMVALSNPCVELWIIIHFRDQTAYLDTRTAEEAASNLLGCGKRLTPKALDHLVTKYSDAKDRAIRLDKMHELNGSSPQANPSSGIWRLVDIIRGPDVTPASGDVGRG